MARITILITSGMALLVVSFNLFLASENKVYSPWFVGAVVLSLLSLMLWYVAIDRAKQEDERKERQMQTLIKELKGVRKDFRNMGKG